MSFTNHYKDQSTSPVFIDEKKIEKPVFNYAASTLAAD